MRPWHIIVVVAVFLLFFGIPRLPELAKSIGKSLKIFKSETKGLMDEDVRNKADAQTGAKLSEEEKASAPTPPRALHGEILDPERDKR